VSQPGKAPDRSQAKGDSAVRYNFRDTERRWQETWDRRQTFRAVVDPARPKYYVLEMFPYPSGRIHMGHVRNYTQGDVVARYRRARGFNVLHPMGWDAFGLPAENAAMEKKIHPRIWTRDNIAVMKAQLRSMGLSLDWSRELATCDPSYYRHQQKLFLDFWKAGLAYRKEGWVNWDPVDNTVLANEQVIDGKGWRTGAPVERRQLAQWHFRTTAYVEELLERLPTMDRWPEKVRLMQEKWIGRSQGARVYFDLAGRAAGDSERLEIFTTRPDTLFGASFMALSVDHPVVARLAAGDAKLAAFVAECRRTGTAAADLESAEKQGFRLPLDAAHPLVEGRMLPVYAANFVLMEYGTGAIFGCPAHDQRDLEFARKYGLPVRTVVAPKDRKERAAYMARNGEAFRDPEAFVEDGILVNSSFLDGLDVAAATANVIRRLEEAHQGRGTVQYRMRDWLVSRQRYWGCPIPAVHCQSCGVVPVREQDLPVVLPDDVDFEVPGNPLARHPTWRHVACPTCGKPAQRETDTFDTFVDSSWYFDRFTSPHVTDAPFARDEHEYWMPVDSTSAASSMRSCICCTRVSGRGRCATCRSPAVTSRSPACSPRAWSATRRIAPPTARGCSRPRSRARERRGRADRGPRRRGRPLGEDVEVEEERRRPRPDHPRLRCRHRALVHAVGFAAGARPGMDRGGVNGAWRFMNRLYRLLARAATGLPGRDRPAPAAVSAAASSSAASPIARSSASARTSSVSTSTRRSRASTSWPMPSRRSRHRRRGPLVPARDARDLRAPDRADDAASGRRVVADAGSRLPGRRRAVAQGRPGAGRRPAGDAGGAGQRQAARHDRGGARCRERRRGHPGHGPARGPTGNRRQVAAPDRRGAQPHRQYRGRMKVRRPARPLRKIKEVWRPLCYGPIAR
jgi:leucyl-tRNA synthetase